MTDRYVAMRRRPRAVEASDDYWPDDRETIDVIVEDAQPVDAGLLDERGVPIYRVSNRAPVGFGR